jgi:transposase
MQRYGQRADGGRMTPQEHEELIRLRREVRRVTEERDILKKAVSIFSKELR